MQEGITRNLEKAGWARIPEEVVTLGLSLTSVLRFLLSPEGVPPDTVVSPPEAVAQPWGEAGPFFAQQAPGGHHGDLGTGFGG